MRLLHGNKNPCSDMNFPFVCKCDYACLPYLQPFDDDGKHPLVSTAQINAMHKELNKAFGSYKIEWLLGVKQVRSTALRRRLFFPNGWKLPHLDTYNRMRDVSLRRRTCRSDMLANVRCDDTCNNWRYAYDGGDCCNSSTAMPHDCIDPQSPKR